MASIVLSSNQPSEPSVVDVGEDPVKHVTLVIGERTEKSLLALANERRSALRARVDENTPVVGPVESVEEALLDVIGGVGACGGASWFYQNFPFRQREFQATTEESELTESTLIAFHHHNQHFRSTDVYVGWHGDANHIYTFWHTKARAIRRGFSGGRTPISFSFAANNYDIVGEITGRSGELQEAVRRLPTPTTSEMFEEARRQYEHDMMYAYRSQSPIGVVVQHPPNVVFHLVHTGNEGQRVVERL